MKLKQILIDFLDLFFCQKSIVSIGDLLLQRGEINYAQFITTARVLDIRSFFSNYARNKDFYYQNTMSTIVWGNKHDYKLGNRKFMELIKSYEKSKYKINSQLVCDYRYILINGTHRLALNYYYDFPLVSIKVLKRRTKDKDSELVLFFDRMPSDDYQRILQEYHKIQSDLVEKGHVFVCVLLGDDFIQLLEPIVISSIQLLRHNNLYVDGCHGVMIQFSMSNPGYYIKNSVLRSRTAEKLYEAINKLIFESSRMRGSFRLSINCIEGKVIFDEYAKYIDI